MNTMQVVVLVTALAGCSAKKAAQESAAGSAAPAAAGGSASAENAAHLATAKALELGDGRARDFAAAHAAYQRGCDGGLAEACRRQGLARLYRFVVEGEGTSWEAAAPTLRKACQLGDAIACSIEAKMLASVEPVYVQGETEEMRQKAAAEKIAKRTQADSRVAAACTAGDIDACGVRDCKECECLEGAEEKCTAARERFDAETCAKGVAVACAAVAARVCEAPIESTCAAKQAAVDVRKAVELAVAACAAGNVDVCARLPGREVPLATLCEQHHRGACLDIETDKSPLAQQGRGPGSVGSMFIHGSTSVWN